MLDFKLLSERLAAIRAERNIAGMTVAVTDSKGIVYMEAFGVDNMDRPIPHGQDRQSPSELPSSFQ